jgi:hypothetical protein
MKVWSTGTYRLGNRKGLPIATMYVEPFNKQTKQKNQNKNNKQTKTKSIKKTLQLINNVMDIVYQNNVSNQR